MPERRRSAGPHDAEPPDQTAAVLPRDVSAVDAVARARAGDPEAFRELVERHSRAVFRVAWRITGRAEDAEDVVQETFLRAYRQLDRFESRANFGTWLYRIAANCAVDLLRARPRREVTEEADTLERLSGDADNTVPSPERALLGREISDRVSQALEKLSDMERAAFTLRHFEGLSIEEIGRALGLRASATKHSIFRAVKKVRHELKPYAGTL
jgi:RNA polymerase sigma-70 factor (ECF subfamily)